MPPESLWDPMESEFKEREATINEESSHPFSFSALSRRNAQLSHGEHLVCILTGTRGPVDPYKYQFSRVGRSCVIIDRATVYGHGESLRLPQKCL